MATDAKQKKLGDGSDTQSISIVWLDSNSGDASEQNISAETKLRKFDSNLKIFKDKDECDQYLKSQNSKGSIILIVNGALGEEIVKSIHYLSPIISIYVFCWDVEKHKKWAKDYDKVVVLL